jgi:hypothetical protein
MTSHHWVASLGFLSLGAAGPVTAQVGTATDVRAYADSFFLAVSNGRWIEAAGMLRLKSFDRYLKQAIGDARNASAMPRIRPEELMKQDSTLPRAVAEWQAAKFQLNSPDLSADLASAFAHTGTVDELAALTTLDGAARWLEAGDPRYRVQVAWKRRGCSGDVPPEMVRKTNFRVLGIALENDSTAYVVYSRQQGADVSTSSSEGPLVMQVFRESSTWRIEPRVDFLHETDLSIGIPRCPVTLPDA